MGTKRRSFLPFLSFPSFLSFQSFLPFLPLETFLSFFSFLPLETFQSFFSFLSFHTGKTFPSFLSFQAFLALSVTVRSRVLCHLSRTRERQPSPSQSACASCATSPARGRGSPLRHSPLARPVPPLPHAGEANVTYRSCLPRLRGRWPAGPERATFTGLRSKNRAPQPWPAGPERAHVYGTAQQKQGTATVARRAGEGSCLRAPGRRS